MTGDMSKRSRAERAGRWGEVVAALALQVKGYVVLERRVKTPRGEIDLIARKGQVLAFVEVKMRRAQTDPARLLTSSQMQRIVNSATAWASARSWTRGYQWRYDLIMVSPWRWPTHILDAWRPQNDPTLERGQKAGSVSKGWRL